ALQLVALVVIAILTAVNCQGVKAAKIIQTTFTSTKAAALALLIVLGFLAFDRHAGVAANFGPNFWQAQDLNGNPLTGLGLLSVLAVAMVGPLFANDAWNNLTFAGEEVKNSEQTVPRSLRIGTLIVGLLYTLTNVAYLLLLPLHGVKGDPTVIGRGIQFALEDRVGTAAAEIIFGQAGQYIMAAAIMISTFGGLNGLILAGPRAYYAMALDGLFFKNAGILHARTNVPTFGLILQGIWAAILTTTGTYGNLLEYVVFAALLFYVLTVIAIFILRRKEPDIPRPFKVPLYPYLPIVYLVLAIAIMIGQIFLAPKYSGFGLLIILSGWPIFYLWRWLASKGN
ncbi:MAG TPA: amino acid permease, partial [Chroococcales cyanobacterium]